MTILGRPLAAAEASSPPAIRNSETSSWAVKYARWLIAADAACIVLTIALAAWQLPHGDIWFSPNRKSFIPAAWRGGWAGTFLACCWMAGLAIAHARSPRIIGSGAEEYRRVLNATVGVFGVLGIASIFFDVRLSRSHIVLVLPVGVLLLLLSRWAIRFSVGTIRERRGHCTTRLLLVGTSRAVREFSRALSRVPRSEYRIVGVCMQGRGEKMFPVMPGLGRVRNFGSESHVVEAVLATGAQAVAVTASKKLVGSELATLSWELEKMNVDLLVAPGVVDVAGQRLHMRPLSGLPLIHVEKPQYEGAKRFKKRLFDAVFSSLVLFCGLPVLLLIGLLVRAGSPGPVFYLSERIGLDGKPFKMIKFRTMVQGADALIADLQGLDLVASPRDPVKFQNDPRVTRVGRILRRYSLDELPQFINVLRGDMSVVGPRPQVATEVHCYDHKAMRRLLVRPGITGLWQVNGRSNLSWEDSIRLDLFYVENWSLTADLLISAKTLKAIVRHTGAY